MKTVWICLLMVITSAACATSNNQNSTASNNTSTLTNSPTTEFTTEPTQSQVTISPIGTMTSQPVPQGTTTSLPNTGNPGSEAVTPPPPFRGQLPNGLRGAQVIPANNSASLNYLTNWMGMRVADQEGKVIGTASDYILNLCESHIIYIVLQTNPSSGLKNGNQILIPFEIVTTAGGTLDADQKVIFLPAKAAVIASAPTVNGQVSLTDLSWEQAVQAYWSKFTRFSLSTQCGSYLPAGEGKPLTSPKIGLASRVLGATLQDEKKQTLGKVTQVVVAPVSGFLRFLAVQLDPSLGNGLALVPTGALTVKDPDTDQEGSLLTLIVENRILANAPKVPSLPDPGDMKWEDQSTSYWSQYVKMTK